MVSASRRPAAHQRRRMSPSSRHRFTLRVVVRAIEIIDSIDPRTLQTTPTNTQTVPPTTHRDPQTLHRQPRRTPFDQAARRPRASAVTPAGTATRSISKLPPTERPAGVARRARQDLGPGHSQPGTRHAPIALTSISTCHEHPERPPRHQACPTSPDADPVQHPPVMPTRRAQGLHRAAPTPVSGSPLPATADWRHRVGAPLPGQHPCKRRREPYCTRARGSTPREVVGQVIGGSSKVWPAITRSGLVGSMRRCRFVSMRRDQYGVISASVGDLARCWARVASATPHR